MALLAFTGLLAIPPIALQMASQGSNLKTISPLWKTLKAFNLCLASTIVSVTCVLNFSLAISIAAVLSPPLIYASPSRSLPVRLIKYLLYNLLGFGWIILYKEEIMSAIWNWELLGVWFAPFICIVYAPLVWQSALVCILSP